jgi:hypothetical protein
MNSDYYRCTEFEKAVDYNDIRYYRPEEDRFNSVKSGWYMYSIDNERPSTTSLEPFAYCPWCSKKLAKPA